MALIKCKECGKEMSDKAKICPHCGLEQNKKKRVIITSIIVINAIIVTLGIVKVFFIDNSIGNAIKTYQTKQNVNKEKEKYKEDIEPYLGKWKLIENSTSKEVKEKLNITYNDLNIHIFDEIDEELSHSNNNTYCGNYGGIYYSGRGLCLSSQNLHFVLKNNKLICEYDNYVITYEKVN